MCVCVCVCRVATKFTTTTHSLRPEPNCFSASLYPFTPIDNTFQPPLDKEPLCPAPLSLFSQKYFLCYEGHPFHRTNLAAPQHSVPLQPHRSSTTSLLFYYVSASSPIAPMCNLGQALLLLYSVPHFTPIPPSFCPSASTACRDMEDNPALFAVGNPLDPLCQGSGCSTALLSSL